MVSAQINEIYTYIVSVSKNTVGKYVNSDDLTGKINFASIYAASMDEYDRFNKNLLENGSVFDAQTSGTYYRLHEPLKIGSDTITICRVRKPDAEHTERGYCDFQVKNYRQFKETYADRKYFGLLNNQHGIEMVELSVPETNIRIYFPNTWE